MYIQSGGNLPATIEEDDMEDGNVVASDIGNGSIDSHQLQTLAEVLPIREPVDTGVRARTPKDNVDSVSLAESSSSAVERFRQKRRVPFLAFGEGDDDNIDTHTVINDLFGEELEMMDKERLVARYDVLNLEDIGIDYDEDKLLAMAGNGDSATSETRLTSPPGTKTTTFNVTSLRKKSEASNFSTWDDFDASFNGSGSERGKKPLRLSASGSSITSSGPKSGKRKAVRIETDEF